MPADFKISGNPVRVGWTQDIASRYSFRAAKIGGAPKVQDFTNPKKAAAAVTSFLWLVLPPEIHRDFATPEDLYVAIQESEIPAAHAAVIAVIEEMAPDLEKKSTLSKPHSPASS